MITRKEIIGITLMLPFAALVIYLLWTNILIQLTALLLGSILLFAVGFKMFFKEDPINDEPGDN